MAYDADGYQFNAASPIMSSGIDPEALLAMDPDTVAKAKAAGLPVGQAWATGRPVGTNPPQPSGTSANQPTQQVPSMLANPNPGQPMMPSEAMRAQQAPAGASQLAAAAAPPAVPGNITPDGKPDAPANPNSIHEGVPNPPQGGSSFSDLARGALQSASQQTDQAAQLAGSTARLNPTAIEQARVAAASPQSAQNPTGTPNFKDPDHPEYRPSVGRRIVRGIVGGLEGLAEGGIRGSLLGAVDPEKVGATGYGAPTKQFSQAAQMAAGRVASLDQQLQQADTQAKTGDEATKTRLQIAAQYSGISKDAAANLTAQNKSGMLDATLAKAGMKAVRDEHGNLQEIQDDPDSEVYKSREAMSDLRNSQQELADAKAALARAQNDPNSPAFKAAQKRAATAAQNADAAGLRAKAYWGNYLAGNLGKNLEGGQIEGSATSSEGTPIGSKFAAPYIKQEGKVAQFNDVIGATDNIEKTAQRLIDKGGKLNSPRVATAIADPKSTSMQWAQGEFVNSGLTPEERDYVTNVKAYKENLQALRQSAGGGVSDAQVNRLMEMAPGASTPDMDYLKRQTTQIRQTAGRLSEGVPSMKGGHQVNKNATGDAGMPPQSVIDGMKDKQYVHGPGGSFQKVDGKLVPVKGGGK